MEKGKSHMWFVLEPDSAAQPKCPQQIRQLVVKLADALPRAVAAVDYPQT